MSKRGGQEQADVHGVALKYGILRQVPVEEERTRRTHSDPGETKQWDGAVSKRHMEVQSVDALPKQA